MEVLTDSTNVKSFQEDPGVILNKDCRICLKRCTQACQLFRKDRYVSEKLMAFAAVQVEEGDGLPSVICLPCCRLLDVSYDFQCQIQKSDTKLREILKLGLNHTRDIDLSVIVTDETLHKKFSNTIVNHKIEEHDNIAAVESTLSLGVQNFPNDRSIDCFTSEIKTDDDDQNHPTTLLEDKLKPYKIIEEVNVSSKCLQNIDHSNNQTNQLSELIEDVAQIKEEETLPRENKLLEDETHFTSEGTICREANADVSLEDLTYDALTGNTLKNIENRENTRSSNNNGISNDTTDSAVACEDEEDDEEKPLIFRTTRLKCPHCIKSFATRLALQRHTIVHKHKTKLRYVCYVCDKQFSNIAKLKNHIFNRHGSQENNQKAEKESNNDKDSRLKAARLDSNCNNSLENSRGEKRNSKFTCKVCSKRFTYQKSFFTHAKSHVEYRYEDAPIYSCETTKNKSLTKQSESDDGNNEDDVDNGNDEDNENDLPSESPQCTQCGKLFATKRNLKRHISTHSGLKYNCSTCGKGFSRVDKLKDHEQSKHKEEIFGNSEEENEDETDNENKADNDSSLDRKKQGKRNRPHKCAMCPKAFAQQQSLTNHMERHKRVKDSQKRFLCEVCSKCFAQSGSLVAHMRTHTGIKPYVCNVCSRAFTKSTYLQLHLRTHSGEKPYICQYCSRAFARANTLARHITMHTGEAKYHCQICTKSFRRLTSLNEHTYTHTGQRPYACKICTKRYNNAGSLYAHTKKCKAQQLSATASVTTSTVIPASSSSSSSSSTTAAAVAAAATAAAAVAATTTTNFSSALPATLDSAHTNGAPHVLIYSQRKLIEDAATVGHVNPTSQYMINVHNQKNLSTNVAQSFTVDDPSVYTVNSKQFKNPYYSIYPNV